MANCGYFQSPTLYKNSIIFQSDDDLWRIDREINKIPFAYKITSLRGRAREPHFSPDGEHVAFISNEMGQNHAYLMDSYGGELKKISNLYAPSIVGWKSKKVLIVCSAHENFTMRESEIFEINIETYETKKVNIGPARYFLTNESKQSLIGKNNGDPARWKRYRGGTAGTLLVEQRPFGKCNYKTILKNIKGNIASPHWWKEKILFISDHEGHGNIYICNKEGRGLKRLTHHEDYYVRNLSVYENEVVYQCGADIYSLDLDSKIITKVDFDFKTSAIQASERFEVGENYLQEYILSPKADKMALILRGQLHIMAPWGGSPIQFGRDGVRYKSPLWIEIERKSKAKKKAKDLRLLSIFQADENKEGLSLFNLETMEEEIISLKEDWGKISELTLSPDHKHICVVNNRNQIYNLNIKTKKLTLIDEGKSWPIAFSSVSWSPDSNLLVYPKPLREGVEALMCYNFKKKTLKQLIPSILSDSSPSFSPDGKYLYFTGVREFHPTPSETHFDISFPMASKTYVLCLEKETLSPMEADLGLEQSDDDDEDDDDKEIQETTIDFEGLEHRIYPLPIPMGGHKLVHALNDKIFLLKEEITPQNPLNGRWENFTPSLYTFDIKSKKFEKFHDEVYSFTLSDDGKYLLLESDELRLVSTASKPGDEPGYDKKNGWIDLSRINIRLCPRKEWKQMYKEAWLLQREHFWTKDMSKINWENVYTKYFPLLEKVNTRFEFSDLIWEMQGELGTSHCYEFNGDYNRRPPLYPNGYLGAEFIFHSKDKSFEITEIFHGDSWQAEFRSPLSVSGVNLKVGDKILAVDGRRFENSQSLQFSLEGKVLSPITLHVKRKGKRKLEQLTVKTISTPILPRYREWVNKNKEYVHKKTKGKIGYVHIPDMSFFGYSEFMRNYLSESHKEGLIIDVRYNGGGSVSQLIFKMISQEVVGFDMTRWYGHEAYPKYSINGPLVCLTNEHAGSDGDIFSHSFKLKGLGKLVGKRTWGGVIGIWTRHYLGDNTMTSQPEFSHWFKDTGFGVENYGTNPDIEVDITPKDWSKGLDTQLDMAIRTVMAEHKKNPPLKPDFRKRPNLKAPKLPKV